MRSTFAKVLIASALIALVPAVMAFTPPKKAEPVETPAAEAPAMDAAMDAAMTDAAATDAAAVPTMDWQNDPLLAGADVERGKAVYQRVGVCVNCHGWNGNGMGQNPRSEGVPADLRETQLDAAGLMDVIRCGIPGTPMPYHFSAAYRDPEVCFGAVMDDFEAGAQPRKGKTFREKDLINLVAYMQDAIIGKGETTLEQCEAYFEPGSEACDNLRK